MRVLLVVIALLKFKHQHPADGESMILDWKTFH
jgi:hypothetical protein